MMFMGGYYDKLLASKLPAGAEMSAYASAAPGSDMANTLNEAKKQPVLKLLMQHY